ncbi:MAG: hypothetical protein AAGC60_04295 [Acidobacteriota bacterium]
MAGDSTFQWSALDGALLREATLRGLAPRRRILEDDDASLRMLFGDEPPLALISFDTPGIQRFIFGVQRPVDIEGGSRIVEAFVARDPASLDEDQRPYSLKHVLRAAAGIAWIYLGGGGGLLLSARGDAEEIIDTIESLLRDATGGTLTSVAAALPVWRGDLRSSDATGVVNDSELAALLGARVAPSGYVARLASLDALRRRRRGELATSSIDLPSAASRRRCAACGERAGTRESTKADLLCRSCAARRTVGARAKQGLDQAKSYEVMVEGLDQGAEVSDARIAVLYADGANFGAAFRQVADPVEHAALSAAVDQAMRHAVEKATERALDEWPELREGRLRYQTPLRGGDDIVLILPARAALVAALRLINGFETRLTDACDTAGLDRPELARLGLGVGIAVADWMFPVQFSLEWARKLMVSAKRCLRGGLGEHCDDGARSAVDFTILRATEPLSVEIDTWRRGLAAQRSNEQGAATRSRDRLTRRPYTASGLREIARRAEALGRHVPPAQIHAMADAVGVGRAVSRNLWRAQHARSQDGDGWAAYRKALDLSLEDVGEALWSRAPGSDETAEWSTDYLDQVDLVALRPSRRKEVTV